MSKIGNENNPYLALLLQRDKRMFLLVTIFIRPLLWWRTAWLVIWQDIFFGNLFGNMH
ncbi:hypothetical protein DZA65_00461 [Dickeya dianthicola]|nr:hypothetical protein DZA65_00461 [Dickeya dianthicola]